MNGEGWVVELQEASNVPDGISPQLLWTDPPFGTGKKQSRGGSEFSEPDAVRVAIDRLASECQGVGSGTASDRQALR